MWVVASPSLFLEPRDFYYSGDPAAGRWVRRILTATGFALIILLFRDQPAALPKRIDILRRRSRPSSRGVCALFDPVFYAARPDRAAPSGRQTDARSIAPDPRFRFAAPAPGVDRRGLDAWRWPQWRLLIPAYAIIPNAIPNLYTDDRRQSPAVYRRWHHCRFIGLANHSVGPRGAIEQRADRASPIQPGFLRTLAQCRCRVDSWSVFVAFLNYSQLNSIYGLMLMDGPGRHRVCVVQLAAISGTRSVYEAAAPVCGEPAFTGIIWCRPTPKVGPSPASCLRRCAVLRWSRARLPVVRLGPCRSKRTIRAMSASITSGRRNTMRC